MNKHLNNWLDEQEGLDPETSNKNIENEFKRQGYEKKDFVDNNGESFSGWVLDKNRKLLNEVEESFRLAIDKGLLRFSVIRSGLSVEFKENLGYTHEDGTKWTLVCYQDLSDYDYPSQLINRITLMLAERLRSVAQDFNGEFNKK